MPFAKIHDLQYFLQLTIPPASYPAAQWAIDDATAIIQNYCRQQIEEVNGDTITLDVPRNATKIFLPELPVNSISSVVEDGETLVVGDDYILGQWGILYRVDQPWLEGIQIVEVTYSHGYHDIPDDIIGVCTRIASRIYQAGLLAAENSGVPGIAGKSLGDYSVTYQPIGTSESALGASAARTLLMSEKEILNRYR